MSYQKHLWVAKEKVTADKLNHIEEGIAAAGQGGGGDISIDATGYINDSKLIARNLPAFINYRLRDNYSPEALVQYNWDSVQYETLADGSSLEFATGIYMGDNTLPGLGLTVGDRKTPNIFTNFMYLSDEAAEAMSQMAGMTIPSYTWIKAVIDEQNSQEPVVEILDKAPEFEFERDMTVNVDRSDLRRFMSQDLIVQTVMPEGQLKSHYTVEDEAVLQSWIDFSRSFNNSWHPYDLSGVEAMEHEDQETYYMASRLSTFMDNLGYSSDVIQDYFPIICILDARENVYIYKFADTDQKLQEAAIYDLLELPEGEGWFVSNLSTGESQKIDIPELDAYALKIEYDWLADLFDYSLPFLPEKTVVKCENKLADPNNTWLFSWHGYTQPITGATTINGNLWFDTNIRGYEFIHDLNASDLEHLENNFDLYTLLTAIHLDFRFDCLNNINERFNRFEDFTYRVLHGEKVKLCINSELLGGFGGQNALTYIYHISDQAYFSISATMQGTAADDYDNIIEFTGARCNSDSSNDRVELFAHIPLDIDITAVNGDTTVARSLYDYRMPLVLTIFGPYRGE